MYMFTHVYKYIHMVIHISYILYLYIYIHKSRGKQMKEVGRCVIVSLMIMAKIRALNCYKRLVGGSNRRSHQRS